MTDPVTDPLTAGERGAVSGAVGGSATGAAPLNVLVVSYRSPDLLDSCLRSVRDQLPTARVLVWDNLSDRSPEVRALATLHPQADWHFHDANVGFARAVNALAERTPDGDLLLLNPDARLVAPLTAVQDALRAGRVAAAAPLVRTSGPRGRDWDNAHRPVTAVRQLVSRSGYAPALRRLPVSDLYPAPPRSGVGYLTGSCLLLSRRAWEDVGPLDTRYFLYAEETDWAQRARRRGWSLRLVPELGAEHVGGGTVADSPGRAAASRALLEANQIRFLREHRGPGSAATFAAGAALLERTQRSKRRANAAPTDRPGVLITSNTLGVGGAERQRVELANGLAGRGYPVTLVLLQQDGPLLERVHPSVRVVRTPWRAPRPDVRGPAVVITGTTNTEAAFGTLWRAAALGAGRRGWLVAAHTPPRPDAPTYPVPLTRMIRRSDGVIALSPSHWRQLTRWSALHGRAPFVVGNGVAIADGPDSPDDSADAGAARIVFAGRLVEHKGVQLALQALDRLEHRRWVFEVVGDGPYRARLEELVPERLANRVTFSGWAADPLAALRRAHLLVLPSVAEAQPMVLLEAMSLGVPVVANAVGAIPDLLGGGAGVVVAAPDADAWADALDALLTDRAAARRIGAAGRERVRARHTVESMLDGYERAIAAVTCP